MANRPIIFDHHSINTRNQSLLIVDHLHCDQSASSSVLARRRAKKTQLSLSINLHISSSIKLLRLICTFDWGGVKYALSKMGCAQVFACVWSASHCNKLGFIIHIIHWVACNFYILLYLFSVTILSFFVHRTTLHCNSLSIALHH